MASSAALTLLGYLFLQTGYFSLVWPSCSKDVLISGLSRDICAQRNYGPQLADDSVLLIETILRKGI